MEGADLLLLEKYLSQVLSKVTCLKSLDLSLILVMNAEAIGKYHQ